jgi:hypothetical protein
MKGIYVIVDRSNGKEYVDSAYGVQYARDNFQLALLETLSMKSDQDSVIHRESFWKEVLFTRSKFGYNKN